MCIDFVRCIASLRDTETVDAETPLDSRRGLGRWTLSRFEMRIFSSSFSFLLPRTLSPMDQCAALKLLKLRGSYS